MSNPIHTTRFLVVALSLACLAGCGQLKIPKGVAPGDLPKRPRIAKAAPELHATSRSWETVDLDALKGKPAVLIGVAPGFTGEAVEWVKAIQGRFGPQGDGYRIVPIVEDARVSVLAKVEQTVPGEITFFASARYAIDYGFVNTATPGEGPHIAVISPDGQLVELVDGPLVAFRFQKLSFVLQGFVPPATPQPATAK